MNAISEAYAKCHNKQATNEVARTTILSSSSLDHAIAFCKGITGATAIVGDNSSMHIGSRGKEFKYDYDLCKEYLGGDRLVSASMVVNQPIGAQRPSQMFFTKTSNEWAGASTVT